MIGLLRSLAFVASPPALTSGIVTHSIASKHTTSMTVADPPGWLTAALVWLSLLQSHCLLPGCLWV